MLLQSPDQLRHPHGPPGKRGKRRRWRRGGGRFNTRTCFFPSFFLPSRVGRPFRLADDGSVRARHGQEISVEIIRLSPEEEGKGRGVGGEGVDKEIRKRAVTLKERDCGSGDRSGVTVI